MQSFNWRTLIVAVVSSLCSVAGTLAVGLPPGSIQQGAQAVANVCQANGFPTAPNLGTPASPAPGGASKQQSPAVPNAPAPAPSAPVVPDTTWLDLHTISAQATVHERPWLRLGGELWRGESRGWLA
ncbi:hypothetical protein ACN28S_23850 [Cystobacter fuscus]